MFSVQKVRNGFLREMFIMLDILFDWDSYVLIQIEDNDPVSKEVVMIYDVKLLLSKDLRMFKRTKDFCVTKVLPCIGLG